MLEGAQRLPGSPLKRKLDGSDDIYNNRAKRARLDTINLGPFKVNKEFPLPDGAIPNLFAIALYGENEERSDHDWLTFVSGKEIKAVVKKNHQRIANISNMPTTSTKKVEKLHGLFHFLKVQVDGIDNFIPLISNQQGTLIYVAKKVASGDLIAKYQLGKRLINEKKTLSGITVLKSASQEGSVLATNELYTFELNKLIEKENQLAPDVFSVKRKELNLEYLKKGSSLASWNMGMDAERRGDLHELFQRMKFCFDLKLDMGGTVEEGLRGGLRTKLEEIFIFDS